MPDDAEFAAYCRVRWHVLVDSLTTAGLPDDRAREIVVEVLADLGRDWSRARRDHEVDVLAWETAAERAGVEFEPGSVAPRMGLPPVEDAHRHGDPVRLVWARIRGHRRRRTTLTAIGAVLALVGAGVVAWWFLRPLPPEVVPLQSPVPVPWYAEGRLHLAEVAVVMDDVDAFVATADGVAVRRADGDLVLVDEDGAVSDLPSAPDRLGDPTAGPERLPHGVALLDEVTSRDGQRVGLLRVARFDPLTGIQLPQAEQDSFVFMLCDPGCRLVPIPGFPKVDVRLR